MGLTSELKSVHGSCLDPVAEAVLGIVDEHTNS